MCNQTNEKQLCGLRVKPGSAARKRRRPRRTSARRNTCMTCSRSSLSLYKTMLNSHCVVMAFLWLSVSNSVLLGGAVFATNQILCGFSIIKVINHTVNLTLQHSSFMFMYLLCIFQILLLITRLNHLLFHQKPIPPLRLTEPLYRCYTKTFYFISIFSIFIV